MSRQSFPSDLQLNLMTPRGTSPTRSVPVGWKRSTNVFSDVQEVFASAGTAIEEHEQEHEPAAAEPPHKKQRTRVADRLHVHGSGGGKHKQISGAVAEKLAVLTHDMLRHGSCVSLEIMRAIFRDICEKEGGEIVA